MPTPSLSTLRQSLPWLLCALLLGFLIVNLSAILTPFLLAFILAYVLTPGVKWLKKRRIPAVLAVTIMIAALIISATLLLLLAISILQQELPALREKIPLLLSYLNTLLSPILTEFKINAYFNFPEWQKILMDHIAASPNDVMQKVGETLLFSGSAIMTVLSITIFIPLFLFYLLKDWEPILRRVRHLVPHRWRPSVLRIGQEIDHVLSQYLRGQFLVMLILAVYYTLTLWLAGFDAALSIGVLTGLAVFIPYIGYGAGLVLALLSALLQFGDWQSIMWIVAIYGVGQIVESFFLTPVLLGERIGLHPLAVIFALLAFGHFFGFFGILLALPASAIISVLLRHLNNTYRASSFYR